MLFAHLTFLTQQNQNRILWFHLDFFFSAYISKLQTQIIFSRSFAAQALSRILWILPFSWILVNQLLACPIWQTNCGVNLISDGCHRLVGFICPPIPNSLVKLLILNKSKNHPSKSASGKLCCSPQFIFASWSIWQHNFV